MYHYSSAPVIFKGGHGMKSAWIILADGFEEVEAVTPLDYLRRAGVEVSLVSLNSAIAVSARKVSILCDALLSDLSGHPMPDALILPGGLPGSKLIAASETVRALAVRMFAEKRLVCAICAAPALCLAAWGLLAGRRWTCYPGLGDSCVPLPVDSRLVVDGNLITAQGAGAAEEFALALVAALCGKQEAEKVSRLIIAR